MINQIKNWIGRQHPAKLLLIAFMIVVLASAALILYLDPPRDRSNEYRREAEQLNNESLQSEINANLSGLNSDALEQPKQEAIKEARASRIELEKSKQKLKEKSKQYEQIKNRRPINNANLDERERELLADFEQIYR